MSEFDLSLQFEMGKIYSLVFQQNQYPLVDSLTLTAGSNDVNPTDIEVQLKADPKILSVDTWKLTHLENGSTTILSNKTIRISPEYLDKLTEQLQVNLVFKVLVQGVVQEEVMKTITIMPKNQWAGYNGMPELLAAFCTPNASYVEEIVRATAETLSASNMSSSIDGYQSQSREKPYHMLSALWNVIRSKKISYVNPSPSYAQAGQRIRLPEDIKNMPNAACLDLAMLFASAIERMGLNPVVFVTKGHAFVGAWLIDMCSQYITNDDPIDLRKKVANQDLVIFETTLAVLDSDATFEHAKDEASRQISEDKESDFVFALDIKQARVRDISPIPNVGEIKTIHKNDESGIDPIPVAPELPPVRREDIVIKIETPDTRVDSWKRKLLDLTKRNRLLNVSSNAVAIKLFCPDLPLLEDRLANDETFTVISVEDTPFGDAQRDTDLFKLETGSDIQESFARKQLLENSLISNDSKDRTEKQILSLFRKTKIDLEEGGSNTLFLSIGMLRWKEKEDASKYYKAPLILLPVELIRKSARSKIKIKQIKGEDPIFNSTLIEFLLQDFEIDLNIFRDELPKDTSGIDVKKILKIVRQKVDDTPGFEVTENVVVSNFSFAKYLMWKDLQDRMPDLKKNPFVDHMIERPTDAYVQDVSFIDPKMIDESIKPSEIFAPLNADSSQLVAIAASGDPQDFVMEGPPGTGKSETIANIICHNIALGKKVLFVAEKMAALNVVYKRLHKVGVSHLCLELHSNKSNKSGVLDQLRRAWTKREEADQSDWLDHASKLFTLRANLNSYVHELHKKNHLGISARDAISRASSYEELHKHDVSWGTSISDAPVSDVSGLNKMYDDLDKLSVDFKDIVNLKTEDFEFIANANWSHGWQVKIVDSARKLQEELKNTAYLLRKLLKQLNLSAQSEISLSACLNADDFCAFIDEIKETKNSIVFSPKSKLLLKHLAELDRGKTEYDKSLLGLSAKPTSDQIFNRPWQDWQAEYLFESNKSFFSSFFGKRKLQKAIISTGVTGFHNLIEINQISRANLVMKAIDFDLDEFVSSGIWTGWDMLHSDLLKSIEFTDRNSKRVLSFLQSLMINIPEGLQTLKMIFDDKWDTIEHNTELMELLTEFKSRQGNLKESLDAFEKLAIQTISISTNYERVEALLTNLIERAPQLNAWCRWLAAKKACADYQISEIITGLESHEFSSAKLVEVTKTAIMRWIAPKLLDDSDTLRTFSGSQHNKLIEDFCKLDKHVAETTAEFIIAKTASRIPNPGSREQPPEYGVLSRQLLMKSRQMSVRNLIREMGKSLLDLTPCMLMSPLSVAQYLPASFNSFDLIVFDEASQITVWDAVGAIARAKNVIVVGDPKQMPPTNFFGRSGSEDQDEPDLESILDQAMGSSIKHHRLTGHYRSRHESLIAFSNSHYYENSLVTFPSAETKESAVSFHKVNGLYAKGKGRNNPIEASAVAQEVLRRLRDPKLSKLSIGIVALNTEQARTIEDELDTLRRKDRSIERFFQDGSDLDPIFVKNLESVQGDERDVIILSIGYGPTEPGATHISMNFGPLNKQGGERRLNVAVTRATTEVLLFASFGSELLDLSKTKAVAVRHLKTFFEFAERGPVALASATRTTYGVDSFDSDFESAVAFKLRGLGWTVETQVGVGKHRIDLGVKHPIKPGKFLAGVECDGATYHSSPSARDRDRVRQIILEGLGWHIIRIWSTDYFIDPDASIKSIDAKLEELLKADESQEDDERETIETKFEEDPLQPTVTKELFFTMSNTTPIRAICKDILSKQNGMSFVALNDEVARKIGIGKITTRFKDRMKEVLEPWAGISAAPSDNPTVWLSKDDMVDFIPWRGIAPAGIKRTWPEISFHERLGIAEAALEANPYNPELEIKDMFQLNRLFDKTKNEFLTWVNNYREYKDG